MKQTMISKACKCGILIEHSKNQFVPILKEENQFFIVFSDKRREIIKFCFFCGGYELGPATEQTYGCECKILEEWSKHLASPIKFDKKFYEYYLEAKDGSTSVFYFCPLCKGKLLKSKRNDFFLKPSESEVNEIYEKIKNVETLNEIIKILGNPDDKVFPNSEEVGEQKRIGQKPVKQTLIYHSIANTFSLIVIEDEDGKIHFLSAGKPKKAD